MSVCVSDFAALNLSSDRNTLWGYEGNAVCHAADANKFRVFVCHMIIRMNHTAWF